MKRFSRIAAFSLVLLLPNPAFAENDKVVKENQLLTNAVELLREEVALQKKEAEALRNALVEKDKIIGLQEAELAHKDKLIDLTNQQMAAYIEQLVRAESMAGQFEKLYRKELTHKVSTVERAIWIGGTAVLVGALGFTLLERAID